jgi:hypothetical protein
MSTTARDPAQSRQPITEDDRMTDAVAGDAKAKLESFLDEYWPDWRTVYATLRSDAAGGVTSGAATPQEQVAWWEEQCRLKMARIEELGDQIKARDAQLFELERRARHDAQPVAATAHEPVAWRWIDPLIKEFVYDEVKPIEPVPLDTLEPLYLDVAQRGSNPEVVAAVQDAISKHPHFNGGSVTAFGFANTAIDAYTLAISSTQDQTP